MRRPSGATASTPCGGSKIPIHAQDPSYDRPMVCLATSRSAPSRVSSSAVANVTGDDGAKDLEILVLRPWLLPDL